MGGRSCVLRARASGHWALLASSNLTASAILGAGFIIAPEELAKLTAAICGVAFRAHASIGASRPADPPLGRHSRCPQHCDLNARTHRPSETLIWQAKELLIAPRAAATFSREPRYGDVQVSTLPGSVSVARLAPRTGDEASNYLHAIAVSIAYAGTGGNIVLALDRVDLSVARGEFVCLLGPSGCGKTTFLNAVAGFLPVSSGELTLNRALIDRPGPDRAMVFQQPALLPWRDVLHNVTYGLEMSGRMRGRDAVIRASSLLELVGLADFARSFPHQLSGGMQQRVNLARALAVEPELLLLDEPFASVDAQTRETLQVELLAICRRAQVTALFVTHDVGEAVFLADRVCIFSRRPGRLVREVRVQLPKPRDEARLKPEFLAYVREVAGVLGSPAKGQNRSEERQRP